jgi:protein gp37
MADETKIEWADSTLNFWIGCTQLKRVGGSACDLCYAKELAERYGWVKWNGPPVRTKESSWGRVASYQRSAKRFLAKHGRRRVVFVNSLSDFFDKRAKADWRTEACVRMQAAPDVIFLLLTKRPENVVKMVPKYWLAPGGWPENVWLGVTVEAQDTAEHRIPHLLAVPGVPVRFLSMEPLLEAVDLTKIRVPHSLLPAWCTRDDNWAVEPLTGRLAPVLELGAGEWALDGGGERWNRLGWVIIGGESGRKARPTSVKIVRPIVAAAERAGVPVLFKQWGEWMPAGQGSSAVRTDGNYPVEHLPDGVVMFRVGKKLAGRRLDGSDYTQFPAERMAA